MIKNNIGDLAPRLPEDKSLRGALAHDELLHNFCTSENFRVENEEVYYDLDDPEDNPYPFYEGLHKGLANQILHEEFSIQDKNYANTPNDPGKLLDPIEVEMDAENIVQQKKIRFLYNSVETNYLSYANSDHDIKSIKYSNDRENPNATTYDNAQKPPDFLPIIDELFSNYTMSDLVEALGTHSVWHMMMWKAQYFLEKFDLDNLKSTIHYVTDNINAIS